MPSKSRLGQNFLVDQQAIRRIVAAAGDCNGRTVVEIGPGKGAITRELVKRAARVLAIEVDPQLAAKLSEHFANEASESEEAGLNESKLIIERSDVLEFDFARASTEEAQRLIVVGNLPYYITSPILTKLAQNSSALDCAVLMVQREVADRVTAEPASRDYGLLTVMVQLYGPVERLFTLPPRAFSPPPEVHSTVFRWRFAPRFEELGLDRTQFLLFLRQIFAQKRKTLANNLRAAGFDHDQILAALSSSGIDQKARAEALPVESIAALWRELLKQRATPIAEAAPLSN